MATRSPADHHGAPHGAPLNPTTAMDHTTLDTDTLLAEANAAQLDALELQGDG